MSYILDALKKSDSERRQRQGPTLASVHQQPYYNQPSRRSWGTLALSGFVLALGCSALWLYQLGYLQIALPLPVASLPEPAAKETVTKEPVAKGQEAQDAQQTALVAEATPESNSTPASVETAETTAAAASTPGNAPMPPLENIRELWQLPAAVRAGIPPLDFSLHVYSSRQDQRSIIINNRMMREGEYVNPQLSLSTITPDGVVMKYRNEYFRVSIVDSW